MHLKNILFSLTFFLIASLHAQVLGPCGGAQNTGATKVAVKVNQQQNLAVHPLLLPGDQAIDFELQAVVGNQLKTVKLSDYAGKWRVLCFFPAAFTFV